MVYEELEDKERRKVKRYYPIFCVNEKLNGAEAESTLKNPILFTMGCT